MTRPRKADGYPAGSLITGEMESVDYFDSYVIESKTDEPVDQIVKRMFALPSWVRFLLRLRYFLIAKPFGLRTGTLKERTDGSDFVRMTVIHRNENEIVMGDDDKHLYYRLSVMKRHTKPLTEIALTTVVRFHNNWGRIYFAFIRPFHKIIVKSILRRM